MRLTFFCTLTLTIAYVCTSSAQPSKEPPLPVVQLEPEFASRNPLNLLDYSLRPQFALEHAHYVKQRRARMLLGVGVGLIASSLIHGLLAVRISVCRPRDLNLPSLYAAAVLGGIGAAFTFGGGLSLVRSRRVVNHPPSPEQNGAAIGVGIGAGLTSQALLAGAWIVNEVGCTN